MTSGYGSLAAQVFPMIALALIIDTRFRAQRSFAGPRDLGSPRQGTVIIYLLIRHALVLVVLLVAEAISLLAAQGVVMGTGAAAFCTASMLGGFVSLIWEPIHEIVSDAPLAESSRHLYDECCLLC